MSEQYDTGGPAFAVPFTNFDVWTHGKNPTHGYEGMTLLDYFAGQAMTLFSLTENEVAALETGLKPRHQLVAQFSYDLAAAMVVEKRRRESGVAI